MSKEPSPEKSRQEIIENIQPLIGRWLYTFQELVRSANTELLIQTFSPGVLGFGHAWHSDRGWENLAWENNTQFEFDQRQCKMFFSRDYMTTTVMIPWSAGPQKGRATLTLQAYPEDDKILCLHYHFSENPKFAVTISVAE